MKHGKQAAAPAPAHALPPGSDAAAAAATTTAEPCLSSPAPLGGPSADLSGLLDMWWDHVLLFFIRHRACAALAVWLAVFLFDVMDLHMPAEWLIFTLFSFSVFVHAFAMSVLLFAALTSAMTVLNIAVFYLLPFSITSLFSTLVVCMLLVRGLHGLDLKGWAVTALMALARLNTPWCETLPNYLQAPIAAYCTSFGFLWLAYHNARRLERLVDPVCLLLGAAPPPPPRIHLVEICHTSIAIAWRTSSSTASVAQPTLTSAHGHYSTNSSQPPISTVPDFPSLGDTAAPSARTLRYEIEANGHIVGNCAPTAAHARIQGLIPTCLYQVRVWAISHNHARSSSLPVFVTTLSARDSEACDDTDSNSKSAAEPALVSANLLRSEIEDSRRTIHGLQVSISDLKASADDERSHLQEEISGLRSKRKDEESLQAAQRDKIRHLESEKRRLDKERLRLDKDITDALARKQRALDRLREQERQVQAYVRDTKSIEADMERERRDHQQQQAELRTTIATLKSEIDKAKQKMASLSVQQTELSDMLKAKRIALAEQEKKNAELDSQIKGALQRKRQLKESQAKVSTSAAVSQPDLCAMTSQLDCVAQDCQHLEVAVANRQRPIPARMTSPIVAFPPPGLPTPSTAMQPNPYSSMYGFRGVSTSVSAAEATSVLVPCYPANTFPMQQRIAPAIGFNNQCGSGARHGRSSSFASSPLGSLSAQGISSHNQLLHRDLVPSGGQANGSVGSSPGLGHVGISDVTTSRRSADFNDMFRLQDRDNSHRLLPAAGSSSARMAPPLRMGPHGIISSSVTSDSISVRNAGSVNSGNNCGAAMSALPGNYLASSSSINEPGTRGFARQLSPADFWSESVVSPTSLSTTMAEASALSILRDTDLAYPTPERPGCRTVGQRTVVWGRQESLAPLPPPTASLPPVFGGSNVAARLPGVYHHPLNRVLTSSTDRLDLHDGFGAPGETPHGRFSSLDLRTAAGGWPEPDYTSQSRGLNGDGNLSGRSSTTNDRRASPCPDMGAFLLRSATPVEPPPLRLSGDMLPIHRPHIEPIGAPVRRRVGGPPSPKAPTRGSSHPISQPPLSPAVQPPPPVAGQYPPGLPISREMSHPSSFGHSLYYKRSLWDLDVAVDSAVTERAKPVSLQSNKAPGNSGGARQHR